MTTYTTESVVKLFTQKLEAALDTLVELEEEPPCSTPGRQHSRKLHNGKNACIRTLGECYHLSDGLPDALASVWTSDVAKEIADMRTAIDALGRLMRGSQGNGFNHPILRISDAPQEFKDEWEKHELSLWHMINRLPALALGAPTSISASGHNVKRGKAGREKWRKAKLQMLNLLEQGKLPKTLRQAQKLLLADGFKESTVRTAAHRSDHLRSHFELSTTLRQQPDGSTEVLDELSGTLARQFRALDPSTQKAIENEWKHGNKQKARELVETLGSNPNAGSTGDVPLIENADQDSQIGDCPE